MNLKDMTGNQKIFLFIVVILVVSTGAFGIRDRMENLELTTGTNGGDGIFDGLFDIVLNVVIPDSDDGVNGDTTPPPPPPPDDDPPENKRLPTSMWLSANPDDLWHGQWFYGSISTNGYNFAISIKASHLGSGETQTIPGFVGPDGMWTSTPQQMKTPGYWTFVATAENGVVSNIGTLTVRGVTTTVNPTHYSRTFAPTLTVEVYTTARSESVLVFANYPAGGWSKTITTQNTNYNGYLTFTFKPDTLGWVTGDYELDATVNGLTASGYDAAWFSIGR